MDTNEIKEMVRARYGGIAAGTVSDCCGPSCCDGSATADVPAASRREMGYSAEELAAVPEGADLGLGCGNPQAIAAMQPGEDVDRSRQRRWLRLLPRRAPGRCQRDA